MDGTAGRNKDYETMSQKMQTLETALQEHISALELRPLAEKRVSKAIDEYEWNGPNPEGAGGSGNAGRIGPENAGGVKAPKCAKENKVNFAACTLEGRALTWWNGNVHTLGLSNANQIPWRNLKTMMTTEYCPRTEIQKMEQELWTLTMKGDDIEGYNNRFFELALMCPDLVTPERKNIERYIRGLPERAKATRIGESNKRKWEDHQRNNNNNHNNNTYHQQKNKGHEVAKAYVAAPAEQKGYLRNRPLCKHCNLHHDGQCPPKGAGNAKE
ncbi:putative reverse transcriptase domain-containing protein [Tanacetum coccineum]